MEGPVVYKAPAKELYGRLRETWERAVNEVLLNSSVVRLGRNIETQRLKKITDITATETQTIDAAMGKCSTHFRGHDQARQSTCLHPCQRNSKLTFSNWRIG